MKRVGESLRKKSIKRKLFKSKRRRKGKRQSLWIYIFSEEGLEKELKKQKESYTKHRLEQIKEYERETLDVKSQPIRQYLLDNLVPILTEGLIEVCKKTPDDPVDHLAEYLFKRSLDVPYPDPTTYWLIFI